MIRPKYNLLFSTSLFIIPTLYGYYNDKYFLSNVSAITMLASMNYWINPISGSRKKTDLIISKLSGAIYFLYGYNHIDNIIIRTLGFSNGFFIVSLYNASCVLYQLQPDSYSWEFFHMMFHISVVVGKMLVLMGC
jgi:hypothetical protein